jgi:methylated-DNA-protein-cysteine methyltransferase-like protein
MRRAVSQQHRPRSRRKPRRGERSSARPPAGGASRSAASEESPAIQAIWHAVCAIPRGQVSTYGAVARAAGFPGRARQAGFALRVAPKVLNLPWHRVVAAGGRIAFPKSSREYHEQERRLRAEGVRVAEGRVERGALTELA